VAEPKSLTSTGVLLAVLIATTMASPALAIYRGDDAPFIAGFTSIPLERNWIGDAIQSLRTG
jgi:hypothetical protein